MSLFGEYIKERLNKSIIENEHGFATYYFVQDFCYIEDIYVVPSMRETNIAKTMADEISKEAISKGYKFLYGSVSTLAANPTQSVKVLLSYGFDVCKAETDAIWFKKVLGEQ